MQKLHIPLFLLLFSFACNEHEERSNIMHQVAGRRERPATNAPRATADNDKPVRHISEPVLADAKAEDSIAFKKYAVKIDGPTEKAKLDFHSNPGALHFKTRITNGYNSSAINFAGHYIGIASVVVEVVSWALLLMLTMGKSMMRRWEKQICAFKPSR